MKKRDQNRKGLSEHLEELMTSGITADAQKLKEDMCTQFANPREWAREYVTNAYDATAMHVWIGGVEGKTDGHRTVTISCVDDGHGMNREEVLGFMTVYHSAKRESERKTIGIHGVGKLSVAAIPNQVGFAMTTSTGTECWRFDTGSLLEDAPINLESVEPVPPPGSRFDITFHTTNGLVWELQQIRDVLVRFCQYLPIEIVVYQESGGRLHPSPPIYQDWYGSGGRALRSYHFQLESCNYEVSLGLQSHSTQQLYQNRVFISSSYNLLSNDKDNPLWLPHLVVRVDSPDLELPFGRHCLRDESILGPLANYLQQECLMDYIRMLLEHHINGTLDTIGATPEEVEQIACRLIHHSEAFQKVCQQVPMFLDVMGQRHSIDDLQTVSSDVGVLYLESQHGEGLDYSVFDAPVLCNKQPEGGLEFLMGHFSQKLVTLGLKDMVMEAPKGQAPELGPQERALQSYLRFHPKALDRYREAMTSKTGSKSIASRLSMNISKKDMKKELRMCQEAQDAQQDLETLRWRVSYLVSSDGRSPCMSRRFLMRDHTLILNLYHPEVHQLVSLAEDAPSLAGHWGLAMALTDPTQQVLEHLSHEARDDLILADAVAKCRSWETAIKEPQPESRGKLLRDFLRNRRDGHFGMIN